MAGSHVYSFVLTDIASGWIEAATLILREQTLIAVALRDTHSPHLQKLEGAEAKPFMMVCFNEKHTSSTGIGVGDRHGEPAVTAAEQNTLSRRTGSTLTCASASSPGHA